MTWRRALNALALALSGALMLPVVCLSARPIPAGDTFWQLRAGELALRQLRVPGVDSFTYTVHGQPWNNHEWGFECALALLYRTSGWVGVRASLVLSMLCVFSLVLWRVSRWATPSVGFLSVSLLFSLGIYKFIPAPQTASMAIFLLAFGLFRGPLILARPARWIPLFAFLVVWSNLSAEALTFIPFLLINQACHAWEARIQGTLDTAQLRGRIIALSLVLMAPLVTPSASSALEYFIDGTAMNLSVNPEFTPLWLPAATVGAPVKLLARALVALCVLAMVRRWRSDPRGPARASYTLATVLLVLGATLFERNLWWLMLPTVKALGDMARRASKGSVRHDLAALALGVCALLSSLLPLRFNPLRAGTALLTRAWWQKSLVSEVLPVACDEALLRLPPGARVLTPRYWGGYVGWRAPGVRVFIDGRNREFPGVIHRAASDVLAGRPTVGRILAASGTQWVLATPAWGEHTSVRDAGWSSVFTAPSCALFAPSRMTSRVTSAPNPLRDDHGQIRGF